MGVGSENDRELDNNPGPSGRSDPFVVGATAPPVRNILIMFDMTLFSC